MRDLNFKVTAQRIEKVGDFSNIVAGTSGYLQAVFSFSTEWSGCHKVASFWVQDTEYPVPIVNNRCMIPDEALIDSCFKVQVTGRKGQYKILTTKVKVQQKEV